MNYIRLGWQQQGKKDVHITTSIILLKHILKLFLKSKYRRTPLNPYLSVESKMYGFSGVMG